MIKILKLKSFIKKENRGLRLNFTEFFLKNNLKFKDLHFVSLEKNTFRGNHKHPKSKEWLFLWEGKFKIKWKDKKEKEIKVEVKEPILIFISENTPHKITNIDNRRLFLLSFGSKYPMDYEQLIIN